MKYVLTGTQMKAVDADTIERIGIPSLVLMERAALCVAEAVEEQAGSWISQNLTRDKIRILIACGTGNNGADGIAAGRILKERGYSVTLVLAGNPEHASEENRIQRQVGENLAVPMIKAEDGISGSYHVIVDALLGIGLTRPVEGAYLKLIEQLGEKRETEKARVVAVDIPSGIQADTGAVMGAALPADVTVTFGFLKTGLALYPGKGYGGQIRVADIGFSKRSLERTGWDGLLPEPSELSLLPARNPDGNKGTFGKVLVIAGSRGMCGAAYLSALAAYRTGAGLVKVLTVPENRPMLQTLLPEAIVETYEPEESEAGTFKAFIEGQCDWADAIVLGPGLRRESLAGYLVEIVLSYAYVPIVLDADGLNTVSRHPYLTRYFTENIIITPHMGEMARLCGCSVEELKDSPVQAAKDYSSRYGTVCVLKDAVTVTADKEGNTWINGSGCSAMAKGGSGDVLTGVIAGLLARGMDCSEAAWMGVYVHGLAGEKAAGIWGDQGVLASNLADCLEV